MLVLPLFVYDLVLLFSVSLPEFHGESNVIEYSIQTFKSLVFDGNFTPFLFTRYNYYKIYSNVRYPMGYKD